MYRLVRITSDDYRDYRRTRSKIKYSFFPKGEERPELAKLVTKAAEFSVPGKGDFLDLVEDPKNAFYFLKDDDEIQGLVELIFSNYVCNICEFGVLQPGQGKGGILYQEMLKVIKARKATRMVLWCPFEGAQIFWRKKGFVSTGKKFYTRKVR